MSLWALGVIKLWLFKTNIQKKLINLTSLLHHGEELVEKLFSLWVIVNFVELQANKKQHRLVTKLSPLNMFVTFLCRYQCLTESFERWVWVISCCTNQVPIAGVPMRAEPWESQYFIIFRPPWLRIQEFCMRNWAGILPLFPLHEKLLS